MNTPLRVAFLIPPSGELPAWENEILKTILDSENLLLVAFIVGDQKALVREGLGLRLFRRFERWWFRSIPDAFRSCEVTGSLENVEVIEKADYSRLSSLNLDIIYSSFMVSDGSNLEFYSKFGLWYFIFGSGQYFGSMPLGFWEVMDDVPEIGCSLLVRLSGNTDSISIYEGTTPTVPYSVKNTVNNIAWKSSSFLPYRAIEIVKGGDVLKTKTPFSIDKLVSQKKLPGTFKVLRWFIRNGTRYLVNKMYRLVIEKRFTISYSWQEFRLSGTDFSKFVSMKLPKSAFWADPFVIQKGKRTYVFFEEFVYQRNKAHISVVELSKDGTHTRPEIVLEKPYHLSYPFIFEFESNVYMVPDTTAQRTVELYRCTEFPFKWKFVKNLMENIIVIDPTLLFHKDKWWLFGNGTKHPFVSTNDQLFVYYSDSPFSSNWISHPKNPVVTSLSNCRPAGRIYESGGKLYRPAQNNSSRQYGYAIKINEINLLNEQEYQETEVFDITPGRGNEFSAIHTLNFTSDIILVDCIV